MNEVVVKKGVSLKKKIVASVFTAVCAVNMFAVNAFAADSSGGSSSDYGSYYKAAADAIKSGVVQMVDNTITVAADIVPIGLAIFGMGWVAKKIKSFFVKVA